MVPLVLRKKKVRESPTEDADNLNRTEEEKRKRQEGKRDRQGKRKSKPRGV